MTAIDDMVECVAIWREARRPLKGRGKASKVVTADKARAALDNGASVVYVLEGDVEKVLEGAASGEGVS